MDFERLYRESFEFGLEEIKKVKGVTLGFHSVIDGLQILDTKKVEEEIAPFEDEVLERVEREDIPVFIETPQDFFTGLVYAFSKGKALQIMIFDKETYRWIMEKFGPGKLRLGGTSANMAVALAPFGFKKVLVYANPLTKDLAELFPEFENIYVLSPKGEIDHPRRAWEGEGIFAIHWIFEFSKGQVLNLKKKIVCPRDNRYIPSWNPVNSKLRIAEHFRKYYPKMAKDFSHFLIAGFHIMKDVYPDGTKVEEIIRDLVEFLKEVKKENPDIFFHVEFASIRPKDVRRGVEDIVLEIADSVGINEVELSWVAEDLGVGDPEKVVNSDPFEIEKVATYLRESRNLSRVHVHTLGYYLSSIDTTNVDEEREWKALAFAALAAGKKARDGVIKKAEEVKEVMNVPLSPVGLEAFEGLKKKGVLVLPTKVIEKPKLTVGLGDTISSLAFTLSLV